MQLHYKMVQINFKIKKQKCEFYRLLFYESINSKFSCFHKQIVRSRVGMFTPGLWEWEESPLEASKGFQRLVGLFDDFIKVSSFNLKLQLPNFIRIGSN